MRGLFLVFVLLVFAVSVVGTSSFFPLFDLSFPPVVKQVSTSFVIGSSPLFSNPYIITMGEDGIQEIIQKDDFQNSGKNLDDLLEVELLDVDNGDVVTSFSLKTKKEPRVIIRLTDKGFFPEEIEVKRNQVVVWRNERSHFEGNIMGLREVRDLQSGFFSPQESFSYAFTQTGEFTFVDAVFVGKVGRVKVS